MGPGSQRQGVLVVGPDDVMDALERCYDPCCRERGLSVVDMGLVESVRVDRSAVSIELVLTSGWCPSVAAIDGMIADEVGRVPGVESVQVEFAFDPVWTPERMSERARDALTLDLRPLEEYREARVSQTHVEVSG